MSNEIKVDKQGGLYYHVTYNGLVLETCSSKSEAEDKKAEYQSIYDREGKHWKHFKGL